MHPNDAHPVRIGNNKNYRFGGAALDPEASVASLPMASVASLGYSQKPCGTSRDPTPGHISHPAGPPGGPGTPGRPRDPGTPMYHFFAADGITNQNVY